MSTPESMDRARQHAATLIEEIQAAQNWDQLVDAATWFLDQIGWTSEAQERAHVLSNVEDLAQPVVFHYLLLRAYPARLHRAKSGRDRAARLRAHRERPWWKQEMVEYLFTLLHFRRQAPLEDGEVFQTLADELDDHFFDGLRRHYAELHHPPFVLAQVDDCTNPHGEERRHLLDFLRTLSALTDYDGIDPILNALQLNPDKLLLSRGRHRTRRPLVMHYLRSGRVIRVTGWLPRLVDGGGHKLHW